MAESLYITEGLSREQAYEELIPQIEAVISAETDLIANLANISAMLKEAMGFFWIGFYRWNGAELVLGPFQGPLACTRIAMGKGVCGSSAERQETLIVPDVELFPGHIACSALSRSEIVVPLVVNEETQLILDVDSDQVDDFSPVDQKYLERLMKKVGELHYRTP
ncbi:MAG: GAF domain-containing protein [Bacteroidota bacterium]